VLEKAGYEREGILRASAVKFGKPRDQAIYARINTDWGMDSSQLSALSHQPSADS
jgi:RimJ/RimL family protein N-acetyltransferase